jgi:pyrroloquinoline quinone biosynthesis protein D
MTDRIVIAGDSVPRFLRGARLQFDHNRNQWIVQAPERVFVLDDIAREILQRCDGQATVAAIVDDLAGRFAAPREVIEKDVSALLQQFADKGVMTA